MSQRDSVQSVDLARELPAPRYGERFNTFDDQALFSEGGRRSNDVLLASIDRKKDAVVPELSNLERSSDLESRAATILNDEAVASTASLDSKQAVGKLESVTGWVTIVRANGAIIEAHSGEIVRRGDAVQTGGDSAASIRFLDGTSFELSAGSRMTFDGFGAGGSPQATKLIQLASSDVRVDDEAIRPFGVYDLLEGSRVIDTIDNPEAVVEVRRTPTGQISVTRSSADPSAQSQHYNDALQIQNLGAQYGINSNGRGSGGSPGPFLQPINFTIDLPGALGPPSIDPIGARVNPFVPRVPDDPVILIPRVEPPPIVRASLTPVPTTGPSFADTVTFDEFTAVTGTVSTNNPNPGTTLTFGISGGSGGGTSSSGPVALSAVSPIDASYDVSARGTYGTLYLSSATGAYIFVPDDGAINALTEDVTETFIITVSDGTTTISQPFTILLNGENDEPLLSPVTGSAIADTATLDDFNAVTGTLQATDVDAGAVLTYGIAGGASGGPVVLDGVSYDVSQRGTYGTLYVNSATGAYVFAPDDAAVNALTEDTTETFTITVSDGTLSDSQPFTVTLHGENDKPVLTPVTGPTYTDTQACDDFTWAAGTLQASDVDTGATLTYGVAGGTSCHPIVLNCVSYDVSKRGDYGTLYVNSESGAYVFVPDDKAINGLTCDATETFTFTVSDGALTDSQPFEVTLDGKNDKPVLSPVCGPTYTDTPACDDFAPAAGRLQASDADAGTTLSYGIAGGTGCHPIVLNCVSYDVSKRSDYGTLYVNSGSGAYVFVPDDGAINGLCHDTTETFTLTVSDGELCDSQPFTVTLNDRYDNFANNLTASNDAMPEAEASASVAETAPAERFVSTDEDSSGLQSVLAEATTQPDVTAESRSLAPPAGEATDIETMAPAQTGSVESSWIENFASHGDDGDQFDLVDVASVADPAHASPVALVVSTEGLHSFIFHSPPAWGIQSHAPNSVDNPTEPAAGPESVQPSVDDANNNNDLPANQALDVALSTLQLQLRAESDHFILQA